jgi:hypothetical protein
MNKSKLRLALLGTVLATSAVFAGTYVKTNEPLPSNSALDAPAITANETIVAMPEDAVPPAEESRIVETSILPAPAPARSLDTPEPSITVTEQRLTNDERIQGQVMDVLANDPHLSGKIGVVSDDAVVTLNGYTSTAGQARRAGRDAHAVDGVRYVVNEIRPRVGAVTY